MRPYPYAFVPSSQVSLRDRLWAPRLVTNRTVTVPHCMAMCEATGILSNYASAAACLADDAEGCLPAAGILNSDAVVYKTIEAASYVLAGGDDAALDARLDTLVSHVAAAQESDGYLLTRKTIAQHLDPSASPHWAHLGRDLELYIGGHLYEAAAAHFQATGKRTLLDVAIKHADLVDRLFGPEGRVDVGGHPEIEPALVRLYEATGEPRYWRLAQFFVETRGTATGGRTMRGPFSQDHEPVKAQSEAVGQAPRATYLYAGVADIAALTGDEAYTLALERLWHDVVARKLYVTGGIGSRHENEGFGDPYDLPNLTAYAEACAAISLAMWAVRMFRLRGEAQYLDVLERTLYNNFLATVSLEGDGFFYACPPESDGAYAFNRGWLPEGYDGPFGDATATRRPWFACACCPPNIARWLAQVPGFVCGLKQPGPDAPDGAISINLFAGSDTEIDLNGQHVTLTQRTDYPWDGEVSIHVQPERSARFPILMRIPGWSRGEPVPSDLYRDAGGMHHRFPGDEGPSLAINGEETAVIVEDGFVRVDRCWRPGDVLALHLPMPVRRVVAHPAVTAAAGKVALERGPIVYCVEGVDHDGAVRDLILDDDTALEAVWEPDFLGGVVTLRGRARRALGTMPLLAIPYAVWSHRGAGEMTVWMHRGRHTASGSLGMRMAIPEAHLPAGPALDPPPLGGVHLQLVRPT